MGKISDTNSVLTTGGGAQYDQEALENTVKSVFDKYISEATLKALVKMGMLFLTFVLGSIVTVLWNLNSDFHKVSGQYGAKSDISEFKEQIYKDKISQLEKKLSEYECLDDPIVKNKAECRK